MIKTGVMLLHERTGYQPTNDPFIFYILSIRQDDDKRVLFPFLEQSDWITRHLVHVIFMEKRSIAFMVDNFFSLIDTTRTKKLYCTNPKPLKLFHSLETINYPLWLLELQKKTTVVNDIIMCRFSSWVHFITPQPHNRGADKCHPIILIDSVLPITPPVNTVKHLPANWTNIPVEVSKLQRKADAQIYAPRLPSS